MTGHEARVLGAVTTGMNCWYDENKEAAAKVFDYRYSGRCFLLIGTQLGKVLWALVRNCERLSRFGIY
jgi:hypothetical protein